MHQTHVCSHAMAPRALHPTVVISRCGFFLLRVCKQYWLSLHFPRALSDFVISPCCNGLFFPPEREIHLDNKNFSNFCAACLYDGGGKGSWAQEGGGVFMVVSGYLMFSLRAHPGLFPQTWYSLFTPLAPSWCPVGFTSPALSRSPCWMEHSQEHPDRNPGLRSRCNVGQR